MGLIEDELSEVRKLCENVISGSRLISCVQSMVRVEIKRTLFKNIVICLQFAENYPSALILFELKSKTLSENFLKKLTLLCEKYLKDFIGKPQIIKLLHFINNFLHENPLCCCYDEILSIKNSISKNGEIKVRQKSSSISLHLENQLYFLKCHIHIPNDYPENYAKIENLESNFPPLIIRFILGQAKEIGRQCVEPPLRKLKPSEPAFKKTPSLEKISLFVIRNIKDLPNEICSVCKERCFPENPSDTVTDESSENHVERIYCGHLLHLKCLALYMKKPPFQNKKCPKENCNKLLFHAKWGVSEKLAENRWAHEQARERELAEVTEFFE